MKVLMFGWEYPPHVFGGLATANYGISEGLKAQGDVETVLLLSAQEHLVVSSSLVRELLKCGASKSNAEQKAILSKFVPKNMVSMLLKEFRKVI